LAYYFAVFWQSKKKPKKQPNKMQKTVDQRTVCPDNHASFE